MCSICHIWAHNFDEAHQVLRSFTCCKISLVQNDPFSSKGSCAATDTSHVNVIRLALFANCTPSKHAEHPRWADLLGQFFSFWIWLLSLVVTIIMITRCYFDHNCAVSISYHCFIVLHHFKSTFITLSCAQCLLLSSSVLQLVGGVVYFYFLPCFFFIAQFYQTRANHWTFRINLFVSHRFVISCFVFFRLPLMEPVFHYARSITYRTRMFTTSVTVLVSLLQIDVHVHVHFLNWFYGHYGSKYVISILTCRHATSNCATRWWI